MRWLRTIFPAAGLSLGIALLLPFIVDGGRGWGTADSPVASMFGRHLTDAELVDGLARLPLQLELRKVDWSFSVLSVDLQLSRPAASKEEIYRDLLLLSHFSFVRHDNVKHLFVRINDFPAKSDNGTGSLLLAMNAKGDREVQKALSEAYRGKIPAESLVRSHFRMTFTHQWREKYESPNLRKE